MNQKEFLARKNIGKKFTEVIGDDYKHWNKGDVVILNGATGSGKTYFVENVLGKYSQKNFKTILFLCNRSELAETVRLEVAQLGLSHVVDVKTYQDTQNKKNEGKGLEKHYTYVVYDECHYLTTEGWNQNTDIMWNFFLSNENKYIHIFMSGTGKNIFSYLRHNYQSAKNYEYIIPYSYNYVTKTVFYEDDEKVEELFDNLEDGEKIIYFSRTLDRAYELFKKYQDKANFICSKYCKYASERQDCIKVYNKDLITFEKQILIATTALDVGVTIKDKCIKYIVTDLVNINQVQQCLGRKRIVDKTDTCEFYIKNHSKKSLNGFISTMENTILKDATEYYSDREKFIEEKGMERDLKKNPCFMYKKPTEIDNTKNNNSIMGSYEFNYFTYIYYKLSLIDLKYSKSIGFDQFVLERLGDTINNIEYVKYIEEQKAKNELELYLESIIGVKFFGEDKKQVMNKFKEFINSRYGTIKVDTMNGFLKDNNYKYFIEDKQETKGENRKKRYIQVLRLVEK